MPPRELPVEIVLKINLNLDPRDHRERMSSLVIYSLLNKLLRQTFEPLFFQHLHLAGDAELFWRRLVGVVKALRQGGEDAYTSVRTFSCSLVEMHANEREEATLKVGSLAAQCPRIEELAFCNMERFGLVHLLSRLEHVRVLHLSECSLFYSALSGDFKSRLQHLAVEYSSTAAPLLDFFPDLQSLSDPTGDLHIEASVAKSLPHATSLRLMYDAIECRHDWPPTLTSLDIVDNESLEACEHVIRQLLRLHSTVSAKDLQFLERHIAGGDSPLKHLRLTMREEQQQPGDDGWRCTSEEEWEELRVSLEKICRAQGVQVTFHEEEGHSAVEFWEECTREVFVLEGFQR